MGGGIISCLVNRDICDLSRQDDTLREESRN